MKNIYIYCEGQSEEAFVNQLLCPYFIPIGICTIPIICTTKKTGCKKYKGGMQNYEKIHHELTNICKTHRHEIVTTMFDYYGMPNNTPSISCNEPDIYKRISVIEDAILLDIDQPNLIANLMLHEFEALLFADPQAFDVIADEKAVNELQQIRDEYESPEYINNSIETAPSKRIIKTIVGYSKVRQGIIVAQKIGIDRMVSECKHFAEWIEKLKTFRS